MVIIGIGNPGSKYLHHRHTVGHMFVNWIAKQQLHSSWHTDSKKLFDYQKVSGNSADEIIIAKTRTYMNESGSSVLALIRYFDVKNIKDIVVVHDDLDLLVGMWRLDFAKGPKLHNGINSIESSNRANAFWRLRIGVDNRAPENRIAGDMYVLQDFTAEELEKVSTNFPAMWNKVIEVLSAES